MRVTVFAPDDLQLVKGGPAGRRDYLDDLLVAISPRYEAARSDYERVLKQRNALLRGGLRGDDAASTLEIFDLQLAAAGAELARGRLKLLERLVPAVAEAYDELAGGRTPISTSYEAEWASTGLDGPLDQALLDAFAAHHKAEVDRGLTLVGPAPRRVAPADRRAREPHARVAGGAAHAGARVAPRRPSAVGGAHRQRPGAPARRRVQRARRPTCGRAGRASRRRADPGDDGGHGSPWDRGRPDAAGRRRPRRGGGVSVQRASR